MARAYYNEIDPFAAQWLRNLIATGHIAPGDVDERSIVDVTPKDLEGYTQCHFFAGIGVWSYALRQAGWPDDRPVWTGSCPCQPFSAAGKRGGTSDDRHLWPAFGGLIAQCRPRVVFGEQVASKDGLAWLDIVHADLEAAGYAVGSLDLCAAGVGAPHIRQRLFFVADATGERRIGIDALLRSEAEGRQRAQEILEAAGRSDSCELADADDARPQGRSLPGATGSRDGAGELAARETGATCGVVAHDAGKRLEEQELQLRLGADELSVGDLPARSFWSCAEWLACQDGKSRPVEPGTFPLAHGAPARVGRLRAYGNAIVAPVAVEFIRAYMECGP